MGDVGEVGSFVGEEKFGEGRNGFGLVKAMNDLGGAECQSLLGDALFGVRLVAVYDVVDSGFI